MRPRGTSAGEGAPGSPGRGPLVSVVIPCFNRRELVGEAIDSALGQRYAPLEVVVVDDGSTDGSERVVASRMDDGRLRLVRQENRGPSAARNAGIAASRGRYLAFLDADDYWSDEFLSTLVPAAIAAGAGIAYCGWRHVGVEGGRARPFVPPDYEADPDKIAKLVESTRWPIHAAIVDRRVVERVGGFDPRWPTCNDFDFWLRAATSCRLVRVPRVLAFYRHHGGAQVTDRAAAVALNHWRIQREFLDARPDLRRRLGRARRRAITHGYLLRRGYELFWQRRLDGAQAVFRTVLRAGYARPRDLPYLVAALLPRPVLERLVRRRDRLAADARPA